MFKTQQPHKRHLVNRFSALVSMTLLTGLLSMPANAACENVGCACKASEIQFASPAMKPNKDGEYAVSLEADDVSAQNQGLVTLTGNAEVTQGRQTIVADQLQYYRDTDRVVANGNIEVISQNGDYLSSDAVDIHVPTQIGILRNTQFKLAKGIISSSDGIDTVQIDSRGSAGVVNLEGEGFFRLEEATYTTCPEGDQSVMISANELSIDQNGGIARAHGATVRFKGIPFFYTPYLSFPINGERKTGFLVPGFGSDEESGNIFEFPWYWNIAKNQDATITPRYYTDRGLQLAGEYRLKTPSSTTYLYGEILPGDDLVEAFNDTVEEQDQRVTDRGLVTIQHMQQFTDRVSGRINYNDVSDAGYFDDLRNEVSYFSATYVPRDVQLNYSGDYLRVRARANEYQIIDPGISNAFEPYERRPSVTFGTSFAKGPYGIKYGLDGSYTNFNSDSGVRVDGARIALDPYIEIPFESIWGYMKPSVSVHHRSYSLGNIPLDLEGDPVFASDDPSFTVPVYSVDTGIYLEKNTSWFGNDALHTLEPRIFYAYAPNEDQSGVPQFDASQVSLNNFSNIFRANRFYGSDVVGDTNQITLGVTTRIIDSDTGDQRLKASVGQLYLIDDLQENVFSNNPIESGLGDFLAEMRTESKEPWTTYSFFQYDHDESEIRTARFELGYEPKGDNRKRISLGYYHSNGVEDLNGNSRDTDQLTVNVNWPISDRFQFFGSERYSLEDSESLFSKVGVQYDSCCWAARLVAHNRINNRDIGDKKTSFFLELELTALGSIRTGF